MFKRRLQKHNCENFFNELKNLILVMLLFCSLLFTLKVLLTFCIPLTNNTLHPKTTIKPMKTPAIFNISSENNFWGMSKKFRNVLLIVNLVQLFCPGSSLPLTPHWQIIILKRVFECIQEPAALFRETWTYTNKLEVDPWLRNFQLLFYWLLAKHWTNLKMSHNYFTIKQFHNCMLVQSFVIRKTNCDFAASFYLFLILFFYNLHFYHTFITVFYTNKTAWRWNDSWSFLVHKILNVELIDLEFDLKIF